jgi:general secretion pathway protein G
MPMPRTNAAPTPGFTLIELLVVLVILGLLASVVAPNVMSRLGGARTKTARVQIEDFGAALDLYQLETGTLPGTEDGLGALVRKPAHAERWNGPYLKKSVIPKDPWGNDYHYQAPGEHGPYDLYSLGADNAPGGEGENADVTSWD